MTRRNKSQQMMRQIAAAFAATAFLGSNAALQACPSCRPLVKSGVYNSDFGSNLLVLLLPIAVLAAIGFGLYFSDAIAVRLRGFKGGERWQARSNAGR